MHCLPFHLDFKRTSVLHWLTELFIFRGLSFIFNSSIKVVICGIYKNLYKITKIKHASMKFHRLLIFATLYSLECKIEGHAVYKSVLIRKDHRDFCARKSKESEIASLMKMR